MSKIETALIGGRVRTMDPERPSATAVALGGGRIVAVGDDAEISALCDRDTELISLDGAAVLPGLIDSHMHPFHAAHGALGVDLLDAHTLDEVLEGLASERAKCKPGGWVQGWGLDYNVFRQTGINSAVIDDVLDGAPASITFMDAHTVLASSKALELAGIDGPRHFEEHAEVVCDDGRPTGELREWAAMDLLRSVIPELSFAEQKAICAEHLRKLAAVGITYTHAMDGTFESLEMLRALEADGDLVTRILQCFTIEPDTPEEQWLAYADAMDSHGARWRCGFAKFFIDGVIDSGTGWLFEPDSNGQGLESFWPDVERYHRAVKLFAGRGFQCVTHATGDRGVHEALDAYEAVGAAPGVHHRVEHIETLQPFDLPRFAKLGVVASMQPQHMMWIPRDRSDNWASRLGDDRCERAFMTRSLLESGALISFGSDWPVARYDWREGMAAAQLRHAPSHPEWEPFDDQAVDPLTALAGYTTNAAITGGDGDRLGALKAGKLADITVLAEDPVTVDPYALLEVPTVATIVDGEVVFRDGV